MEDWQQWQIRADQIAEALGKDVDVLDEAYFSASAEAPLRTFWPKFRDLKERVRTAPAIKLEDKLALERRLRNLGSKAYKAQEALHAQSEERKNHLLESIADVRRSVEETNNPRALRRIRRDLDAVRKDFDNGPSLVPADRQAVWEAWRETNQIAWERLNTQWSENESYLRSILTNARDQVERGNGNAARQAVGRFFEALRSHESKQTTVNELKAEADGLRRESDALEERRLTERASPQSTSASSPVEGWRAELDRNRELAARLSEEVGELDRQFRGMTSILEQAMIRGNLVEKRRKLSELERANRTLEQRIEQSEETPLITAS